MRERPILFSGAMVRAILAGHKTQTRRVLKARYPPPPDTTSIDVLGDHAVYNVPGLAEGVALGGARCPYGGPGDRLWVREKVTLVRGHGERASLHGPEEASIKYDADGTTTRVPVPDTDRTFPWKRLTRPSIHMPRWACRLVLEVEDVRVEHLQDISVEDAWAEGSWNRWYETCAQKGWAFDPVMVDAVSKFRDAWNTINGPGAWDANPWVWVVTFRRVSA